MFQTPSLSTLPNLAVPASPAIAPAPTMLVWNAALAADLGIDAGTKTPEELARLFSGPASSDNVSAYALAYAGHQFGQFVPQLGDGRAALVGELAGSDGRRYDVQLKGSGITPFSRGGDGKSAIGPVLREYVLSEAMHALGVPTTRALAAVATGERVIRDDIYPGAVLTRVASSHLRVGTFQYFAARGDVETLRALADYAIGRHYPEAGDGDDRYLRLLRAVAAAQANLVAGWMSVGFIHGVMNTDNSSIAGETLDYGPCAFMDEFKHDKVFSSIDHGGRYAFSNQAPIAQWNLARLAECLLLVSDVHDGFEEAVHDFLALYERAYGERMSRKLGLVQFGERDGDLARDFLDVLESRQLDYTLSFRALADRVTADNDAAFGEFESRWRKRVSDEGCDVAEVKSRMNAVNPLYIPRNHRIEEVIRQAVQGDLRGFHTLNQVLATPFEEQPEFRPYAAEPADIERVTQTFCGT